MVANVDQAVLGKEHVIRLALTCMLSEGHLLLEDVPGTGKTLLAKAIANTVQGTNTRIQFTPDLLPSDVTGVTIYDQRTRQFEFHRGPIFATIVLADEINRASPKTQSALLEVMEEGRVTVDGVPHAVGAPFMVIATQNPIEQAGTYRLPEAQLDRFLMKTSLGYPDHDATVRVLARRQDPRPRQAWSPGDHRERRRRHGRARRRGARRPADPRLRLAARRGDPAAPSASGSGCRCAAASRSCARQDLGGQRRAATTSCPTTSRSWPQPVLAHRLLLDAEAEFAGVTVEQVIAQILAEVAPPTERLAS